MWRRGQSLRKLIEADREFMRELVLRMERSERAMLSEIQEFRTKMEANHGDFHREHLEMIEELRAGRGALLAMLDRLGPGGATA